MANIEYIDLDIDDYPTLLNLASSDAYVRAIVGCAGSAKTTGIVKVLMGYSMIQEPDKNGVRWTKWLVVRETYQQLISATLGTFENILGVVADTKESPPPVIKVRCALPDGTFVNSQFEFLSMDKPDSISKLLGYEPTGAFLDEVSELSEAIIEAVVSRVGRYPSGAKGSPSWTGVLCATNGALKSHWLYRWKKKLEQKEIDAESREDWDDYQAVTGRPFFELFQQPPALIRPTKAGDKWMPNPLAENIQNLKEGYGYYYKMLSQSDQRIKAYVEGEFSDLQTGELVFPEFKVDIHRVPSDYAQVPNGAPLLMSFDFGRTPVALIAAMTKTGQLFIFKEFVGSNMAVSTLNEGQIQPFIATHHARSRVAGAWGDPSGEAGGQGLELSPFEVLQESGIPVAVTWSSGNQLEPRLASVRKRLTTLDENGNPMLLVSEECTILINALTTYYIYETSKVSEEVKDIPTKTHKHWASDIADSLQYMCLGCDTKYANNRSSDKRLKPPKKRRLI